MNSQKVSLKKKVRKFEEILPNLTISCFISVYK